MDDRRRLRTKLLALVGVALLALCAVYVAVGPPATTYEINIYGAYPVWFWLAICGALVVGQLLVLRAISPATDARANADADATTGSGWRYGVALLLGANGLLLSLPYLRYGLFAVGKGDMLTFVGMVDSLGQTGRLDPENYYPGLNALTGVFSNVTGLDPAELVNLLPPFVSLFYLGGLYFLLDTVTDRKRDVLFVLPVAFLPLFGYENVMYSPSIFAFSFVPFVLGLLFRTNTWERRTQYASLLVLSVVAIVFFHPLTTLFLIGLFALAKAPELYGRVTARRTTRPVPVLAVGAIASVLFFAWHYTFESIEGSTYTVVARLLGANAVQSSEFGSLSGTAARTTPRLVDLLQTGLYTYGLFGLLASFAVVFACYLLVRLLRGDTELSEVSLFFLAVFVVFTGLSALAFFVDITVGFTRISRYARFTAAILVGFGASALWARSNRRWQRSTLLGAFSVGLAALVFLSVFSLYASPLSNGANGQITQSEIEGMEWVLDNRNESLLIDEYGTSQSRFQEMLEYGVDAENIRSEGTNPPIGFAYGAPPPDGPPAYQYLLITDLGRQVNPTFYPTYRSFWRYTPADFDGLERRSTVARVYDNGGFQSYLVTTNETEVESSVASPPTRTSVSSSSGSAASGSATSLSTTSGTPPAPTTRVPLEVGSPSDTVADRVERRSSEPAHNRAPTRASARHAHRSAL
ncbi:hypothetical protein AUR64_07480 [Haloprofundus marisrubri]|uniref:Glycosyltransferase RgtA/B/C/D-like domain-containing protein n=1 Tax=Haloprofundus marisrubri TaxID=1514971 RepID=A0A0W1RC06_9EURY|nr:hypothetical protein AUR64_07480 [Haloprofundus marisrubri]